MTDTQTTKIVKCKCGCNQKTNIVRKKNKLIFRGYIKGHSNSKKIKDDNFSNKNLSEVIING